MKTLLIVDDDPAIREIFSILLGQQGYAVHAASGGRECLDCLTRITPDLIMLDIMMHPVDGWETLSSIRKNPGTASLPVIMFSGKSPSREEILRYGGWIEEYLMKPLTMQTIAGTLETVFARFQCNVAERDRFLQNGADAALVEEYFRLRKFLYVRQKFYQDLRDEPGKAVYLPSPEKARLDEITLKLSPYSGLDPPDRGEDAGLGMAADPPAGRRER
jgi:CheY-like chemotaxis protein